MDCAINEYDAVVDNDALVTIPKILDAVTYDAVWAVTINADAETQDAEYAFIDWDAYKDWVAYPTLFGNDVGGAYDALKAYEALVTLDVKK